MDIRQYMALTERAIASAFVSHGLYVHLCGSVQGAHTLIFGLCLYEPTQKNITKALGLSAALEAAIADSPVRIYTDRGVILVETPSPMPVTVDGARLKGQGFAVPLGMTSRQSIAGIDLALNPHLLLVGPTNRGKTTAARLVAYHLARQNPPRHARFIVSTFKPKDWQAFSGLAHTFAIITDPAESAQMARYLVEVMLSRTKSGQDAPHIFVFLDDLLNLLGVADVDEELAQLASLGRAAGIHLIIGTQRLGERGAAGGMVTGNIPARLVFGTADAQDAALFTGRGGSGAEKLGRYAGDALLITDGGTQRVAVGYVSDNQLSGLRKDTDEWRPWQSHSATSQSIPVRSEEGGSAHEGAENTSLGCTSTLPNRPPTEEERQHLRRLYEEVGSKNEVLRRAWGGVVNAEGKTPKTKRWLDEALAEVMT
jgi:DNA segregation ATPase FtsK/SpoIIIE-like protein